MIHFLTERYKPKPSEVFVPTDQPLPTSLALLNKRQQQGNMDGSVNEQLLRNVKREIEEQEHWSDEEEEEGDIRVNIMVKIIFKINLIKDNGNNSAGIVQQQKKLLREEELEKIKQQIEALPTVAGPEVSKLLGQRRPPIYMPKESGVRFYLIILN